MTLAALSQALAAHHLAVLGGFHPDLTDGTPDWCGTLLLIGPDEPGFWPHFTASAEYGDDAPNPMDRWSVRVLNDIAAEFGGSALFPFGGPPWHPFIGWALKTGRAWISPVELLVHDTAGLFVSYRGALALPARLSLPPAPARPCDSCADQPCRVACPVGALSPAGYDVPACRTFIASPAGAACIALGCAVRRACPVGQHRLPEQSAFHMKAFAR